MRPTEANLAGSFICQEADFDVTAAVFEKIVLVADGAPQNGYASGLRTKTVPAVPVLAGILIGWAITPTSDTPIKFDGLIGDAVVRTSGTAQAGYNAIPISYCCPGVVGAFCRPGISKQNPAEGRRDFARDWCYATPGARESRPGTRLVGCAHIDRSSGIQGYWFMTNGRCGAPAEEPMVCRLTAGEEWIRTCGSAILLMLRKTGLSETDQCMT